MFKSRRRTIPVPKPKNILTIVLSFCFFLQVRNNVSKFLRRQTTTAMSTELEQEGVIPPVLSFCPGHNTGWDQWESMYRMLNNENVTEEEFLTWIDKRSFDLESIVTSVSHMVAATKDNKNKAFMTSFNVSTNHPGSPFTQVYTWLGRCYVMQFDFPLHPPSFITIDFNLTEVGRLAINAHTQYGEIGLNHGYWPVRPDTFVLDKQDVQAYLEYTKVIVVRDESKKDCIDLDGYDHPKCVVEWARAKFKAKWKKEDETPCWWTSFHYLVMDQDLPLCRSNNTFFLASSITNDIYSDLENTELTGCPKSCRQASYRSDLTVQPSSPHFSVGRNSLFVYMSNRVETVEEYLLFDISEIITAVGGSLGLFLGFSCLSVISYFGRTMACIFSICKNTNNKTLIL